MNEIAQKKLEWLKEELKTNQFYGTPLGDSILKFVEETHNACKSEPMVMAGVVDIINRVFQNKPLTALNGGDEMVESTNEQGQTGVRNKRYNSVCYENGKYYDDTAITFIDHHGNKYHMYQNGKSSRQEINFPYYPVETLVKI